MNTMPCLKRRNTVSIRNDCSARRIVFPSRIGIVHRFSQRCLLAHFREQREKDEKARLEQERIVVQAAEPPYVSTVILDASSDDFFFSRHRKKLRKTTSTQPNMGKGGLAVATGSEKGTSAATALTTGAPGGGKTSARPTLISARGPPVSDRPTTKAEGVAGEETDK